MALGAYYRCRFVVSALIASVLAYGCGRVFEGIQPTPTLARPSGWNPVLSQDQVAVVRGVFPNFQPELFAPGTDPTNASGLNASNFAPALFFGLPQPQGMKPTPGGVLLETNGFDGPQQPQVLPSQGTYFDRQGNPFTFDLGQVTLNPLNDLESRMQVPLSPGAPLIVADRRMARLDPTEVDSILQAVQSAVAIRLPQVASVDIRRCEVVIEPSTFFVRGSNFGDTWAGGMTEDLGNGRYRLHVMAFYINSRRRVADWREYLVSEAINFFVLSIGRPDLAG